MEHSSALRMQAESSGRTNEQGRLRRLFGGPAVFFIVPTKRTALNEMVRRFEMARETSNLGSDIQRRIIEMNVHTVGIDLGKTAFHVIGLDQPGNIVMKKRPARSQLLRQFSNTPGCLIGMEACCGAHHLGTALVAQGHEVRLIPPRFVRPFVESNKNDYEDAEAIAEAVQRPTMRFVPIKTQDQLDLQALHRVRDRLVSRRTNRPMSWSACLARRKPTPKRLLPSGRRARML
jgi:hypothetical protein